MKLQKLVYFAHGWNLALFGRPLIGEAIEAWEFGPVIPSLYREFKRFGNKEIKAKAQDFMGNDVAEPADPRTCALLNKVWETYAPYTAIQLSNATHEKGGPWAQTVRESEEQNGCLIKHKDIENTLIKKYFESHYSNAA